MDTVRYFRDHAKAQLREHRAGLGSSLGLQQVQHQVAVDADYRSWGELLDADQSDRRLAALMVSEPYLNLNGFGQGTYTGSPQERREQFQQWRTQLRRSESVEMLCRWLMDNFEPRKTINEQANSYTLKHLAEEDLGIYVANGELIAAALIVEYPYRKCSSTSPNADFGMSSRSITAIRRRLTS
ncbi:hypothetical protein PXH69_31380 [Rhodococcus qingshengii]|uniref:GNAT family N-acetyltransferase n=1 Tax=Rhodococcus qingshengii TaxID=334542 RepID=A0AAW6LVS0_RHOSG|nr:hypothetical protein [Rhodococcus qingshengii]MDE8649480.1 hypothetical protein [Rhodococcus qingshengii]